MGLGTYPPLRSMTPFIEPRTLLPRCGLQWRLLRKAQSAPALTPYGVLGSEQLP